MSRLIQNIEGEKFGKLTVVSFSGIVKRIGIWKCKCDCGNIKDVRYRDLRSGNTKSCGCSSSLQNNKNRNWKGYEGLPQTIFCIILKNANKRNIPVEIDIKYLWELYVYQNNKCAISGLDIKFSHKVTERNATTASLDRIDSSKGYIEGNVQWVHKDINKMKMDIDQDKFISYCKIIANNNK